MSNIGRWLAWPLEPLHLACGLLALALLALVLRRRRGALVLIGFALAWPLLWSLPIASNALRNSLALRYPPQSEQTLPPVDAIVVLGGGIGSVAWFERGDADDPRLAGNRVALGARAWHSGRAPAILLSGGPTARTRGVSEARDMATAMRRLGVPDRALVLDERSRSTGDNARRSAQLARSHGWRRIALVTSSLHMSRARALFERQGLQVLPLPSAEKDFEPVPKSGAASPWWPSRRALRRSGEAIKEYAGWFAAEAGIGD
ncbi:YdcF family protein [Lysobacter sp. 1R34A]|uniref:YdcF family protein n=1 Tax=Lysobacter sp. 1R34A TaxID=3445786 RepID=UPI003EEB5F05